MNIQRLSDPHGYSPPDIQGLSEKVSAALTRLCKSVAAGGNPFIYCFSAVKPHVLEDMPTAGTDGKKYYWGVEFLRSLTPNEVLIIICHETYHVVLQHVDRVKYSSRDRDLWNISCDFWINGLLKKEHHVKFGGNLGTPISIKDILSGVMPPVVNGRISGCFVDDSVLDKTVDQIYDLLDKNRNKLKAWMDKLNEHASNDGSASEQGTQITLDKHMSSKVDHSALAEEIRTALEASKAMGIGNVPGGVEDVLGSLDNPTIPPSEWIKRMIFKKATTQGLFNDYHRPRRRGFSIYDHKGHVENQLFMPRRRGIKIRWVTLMDTSGSMSQDDIAFSVKELKTLANLGEGLVVPTDTVPYWDKVTRIESMGDLVNTKVHGRGGTAFDQFFAEVQKQPFAREGIDLIIVLTDGHFLLNHQSFPIDTVWVYTDSKAPNPPFGRRINLK